MNCQENYFRLLIWENNRYRTNNNEIQACESQKTKYVAENTVCEKSHYYRSL